MGNLDHLQVLREYVLIRRGEHPGWSGDHVLNSESFAFHLGTDFEEQAFEMCDDLDANASSFSDETGLPLSAIERFSSDVRRSASIQIYHRDRKRPGGTAPQPR